MTLAMRWSEWTQHDAVALAGRVRKGDVSPAELAAQAEADGDDEEEYVTQPKKKKASRLVMMTTIRPVIIVSRRVGQTIFAASVRTWLRNCAGFTLATCQSLFALSGSRPRPAGSGLQASPMHANERR